MECPKADHEIPFHHRRDPFASPFWKIVDRHYDEFERVYPERYEKTHGFWRPAIGVAVGKFLTCGDLREGFARVRCEDCANEYFVPFSCKTRCVCPSCHQKRVLELSIHVREEVCEKVPHRQFVFTMPKRLRIFFRYDRDLLKELPKLAWEVIKEIYLAVLKRDDVVPGMVATVQTFGELAHWHPHVHAIVMDGVFTPERVFIPLLEIAVEPFLELWEHKVFNLLLKRGKITQEVVDQMRSWRHSGFSVHKNVLIAEDDAEGLERLVQYIARCPFSLGRIIKLTDAGQVVYKAEHDDCRKFPDPASENLKGGVARNFQIFNPLDFIAEVTQHIPNGGEHTVRYYGWYSNKARGMRAKAAKKGNIDFGGLVVDDEDTPYRKTCRSRWAALIQKVYEVDPLRCPKCGGEMKIIAFIESRDQPDVVEKILRHCDLWIEPACGEPVESEPRGPPNLAMAAEEIGFILEPEYIPIDEFLANF